jgi:hypothetical protein
MAEAEYVTTESCCAQLFWMRQTLNDYGYTMNQVPLLCDNETAIKIAYNPCEHSRTAIPDFASKTKYSSHVCPGSFILHT